MTNLFKRKNLQKDFCIGQFKFFDILLEAFSTTQWILKKNVIDKKWSDKKSFEDIF